MVIIIIANFANIKKTRHSRNGSQVCVSCLQFRSGLLPRDPSRMKKARMFSSGPANGISPLPSARNWRLIL